MVEATGVVGMPAEHLWGGELVRSTLGDPTFKGCTEEEGPGRGTEKKGSKN